MTSLETIRSLPRFIATSHLIRTRSKCEICQESFAETEEVCALPCFHKYHSGCVLKWLDSSNSCPICRHEVGPARSREERQRARAVAQQDALALNMYYEIMLDEMEDENGMSAANEEAITRLLMEDAATVPAEFGSSSSSAAVRASSPTEVASTIQAMMARNIRHSPPSQRRSVSSNIPSPPVSFPGSAAAASPFPAPRTGGTHTRIRLTALRIRPPPMVGAEDTAIEDEGAYPSMDDPSIIFNGRNPIRVQPPAVTASTLPATLAAYPSSSSRRTSISPPLNPISTSHLWGQLPYAVEYPPGSAEQQLQWNSGSPLTPLSPRHASWPPSPPSAFASLPGAFPASSITAPQEQSPAVDPFGAASLTPARWANDTTQSSSSLGPPPPVPASSISHLPLLMQEMGQPNSENQAYDPLGFVNENIARNRQSHPAVDFASLYNDPNHPLNRNQTALPSFAQPPWMRQIIAPPPPPPPPAPPPADPPPVEAPPPVPPVPSDAAASATAPNPVPPIIHPPPPIVPPESAPQIPPPFLVPFTQLQNTTSTIPKESAPNPLIIPMPTPPPPPPPNPPPTNTSTPTTSPPEPPPPPQPQFMPIPMPELPPISYSDRQPGATLPPIVEVPAGGLSNQKLEFKPAHIPLLGIAILLFYAFSKVGFVILVGILLWYYQSPQGQRRVST